MWHPVDLLLGSSPALRTCAEPASAGSQGSASTPLKALMSLSALSPEGRQHTDEDVDSSAIHDR
jgi:hypothetical protein